jgi:cytochrome b subunit of formate dehydrogenase
MRYALSCALAAAFFLGLAGSVRAQDDSCAACHAAKDSGMPYASAADVKASVHGALGCAACHPGASEYPHPKQGNTLSCRTCHEAIFNKVSASGHGKAVIRSVGKGGLCLGCHGGSAHNIRRSSDPKSATHKLKQAESCDTCHKELYKQGISIFEPRLTYEASAHGQALAAGKPAAVCSDCHGYHDVGTLADARSHTTRNNIPATCGKCHKQELKDFSDSLHGAMAARGRKEAPVCTDCHGEHDMRPKTDKASMVYPVNVDKTCDKCHASERMAAQYGIPADRAKTYSDSYHAHALRAGNIKSANCASCHLGHLVLPAADPRSSVNPANLQATCRQCHKNAGPTMHVGKTHYNLSSSQDDIHGKILQIVRTIYILLIFGTVGFMVVHVTLDFQRKAIGGFHKNDERLYEVRLTLNERWQHAGLIATFTALAYSGFVYVYPDSFLRYPFFTGENGMAVRALTHRVAALLFMLLAVYHAWWALFTKDGHHRLCKLLPGTCDVKDFVHLQMYNVFGKKNPPRFGLITYMEKLEYWALIWGSTVMIITGLALWLREWTLGFMPKWVVDLLILVHYMEAVLACLAIGVWHSYWVVFDPEVYPMNWAWLTGRIGLKPPPPRPGPCECPAPEEKPAAEPEAKPAAKAEEKPPDKEEKKG